MKGAWGETPLSYNFFQTPLLKLIHPMGVPQVKLKPPIWKTPSPQLKSESSFPEMIPRKNPKKSDTVINTCVSIIKQHWKKMVEIPQGHDFLTWGIQTFVKKVKQFVRKHITWLITQFVPINTALLTVLFCNHQLFSNCPLTDLYWPLLKDISFNPKCLLIWCD